MWSYVLNAPTRIWYATIVCMIDSGTWFDDYYFSADLKEAVKCIIKDKDITEQILSVNEGDRFEEITGTLPVRQSGGQSM